MNVQGMLGAIPSSCSSSSFFLFDSHFPICFLSVSLLKESLCTAGSHYGGERSSSTNPMHTLNPPFYIIIRIQFPGTCRAILPLWNVVFLKLGYFQMPDVFRRFSGDDNLKASRLWIRILVSYPWKPSGNLRKP